MKTNLESLSRSLLRLSLALSVPVAVFFGARAIVQAEVPNPPAKGKKISADEMKANFDYLENKVNEAKPHVVIGEVGTIAQIAFTTTNGPPLVPAEPLVTIIVDQPGMYKITGFINVGCLNKIAGDRAASMQIDVRQVPAGVDKTAIKVASMGDVIHQPGPGDQAQVYTNAILHPVLYANLPPGQYTFGVIASGSCESGAGGLFPNASRLVAERVQP